MSDYTLLCILFAPFFGAITLIFVSNRQALLVRGVAAGSAGLSLLASLYLRLLRGMLPRAAGLRRQARERGAASR